MRPMQVTLVQTLAVMASLALGRSNALLLPLRDHGNELPNSYLQIAARQALLDYSVQQGLNELSKKLVNFTVPDLSRSISVPVVGDVLINLSNIKVASFHASVDDAHLIIMEGFYHLIVHNMETHLTLDWYWEKGIHGSGDGELTMKGGNIDFIYKVVTDAVDGMPRMEVLSAGALFDSIELNIHSTSVDWLYQAVLSLFQGRIRRAVQNGVTSALQRDVPQAVNKVLVTLPTSFSVEGLPISLHFDYSIYTMRYVLITGFAEVDVMGTAASTAGRQRRQSKQRKQQSSEGSTGRTIGDALEPLAVHRKLLVAEERPHLSSPSSTQLHGLQGSATSGVAEWDLEEQKCPFDPTPLPFNPDEIALEALMLTIYLHENMVNCMLWGLYRSDLMKYSLVDGAIEKLHLTTDLLAQLIPDLPKAYPHMLLRLDLVALAQPELHFSGEHGVSLRASYSTAIYVDNATLRTPHVATLRASLNISANVTWDSTIITAVTAHHEVEPGAAMDVPTAQWDMTVAWFVQNYAGLFPLRTLVDTYIKSPVVSLASLVNAKSKTVDQWFALSADAQVHGDF